MSTKRWALGLGAILVLTTSSCGGGSSTTATSGVDESKPILQPDGPLRGLLMAGAVKPDGSFTDPRLAFTTSDTTAIAIVGLDEGVPEEAALTIAWYRLTGLAGREHLFSHQLAVGPGGRAYSEGVAAKGLAPGVYETVAKLGERQVRTRWFVHEEAVTRVLAASDREFEWEPPEPGDADYVDYVDYVPPETSAPDPGSAEPCTIDYLTGDVDPFSELKGKVIWDGRCSTMTITATVLGGGQTLFSGAVAEGQTVEGGTGDLCNPRGSDLPGTPVVVTATGSEGATKTYEFTVRDFGFSIGAGVLSEPAPDSRVEAGDTIDLRAWGFVLPTALGIEVLNLDVAGDRISTAQNLSGSSQPEPCDPLRFMAETRRVEFRVPDSPPPVIEVCATAVGFDGNEGRGCASFHTGEIWEGTLDITATSVPATGGQCGSSVRITGTVRLVVADDGTVTGTYDATGPCVSNPRGDFTGTATDSAFSFPQLIVQTNGEPIPKVSKTEAQATLTNFQGSGGVGARWVTTWSLKCTSC